MDLPENFYKLVEQKGYLQHILYGDSVAKDSLIVVMFKNCDYCETITFDKLWDKLVTDLKCKVTVAGNEYVFIDDEFQSLSYDEKSDSIALQSPHYVMRHKFNGKLIRLNFTGHTHLDVTQSHSMLDYSSKDHMLYKKKPENMVYVPVMRNQFEFNDDLDLIFFELGMFIGDGTYGHTKCDYPRFSMEKREDTITFLNECGESSPMYRNNSNNYDFSINNPALIRILENNHLEKQKSTDRILTPRLVNELSKDQRKFVSFFTGYWLADGSYSSGQALYASSNLPLLEQLRNIFLSRGIYCQIKIDKNGRSYKGKVKGDMYQLTLSGINQTLFESFESVQHLKKCKPLELRSTFYGKGTSKQNTQITRKENLAHLKNIKPVKIQSKEEIDYDDNVYDLSFDKNQNFFASGVLVHNTDSIFLTLPVENADQIPTDKRWELAEHSAEEINKLIIDYTTRTLLPRCNINPQHNKTFFKTELLIDAAMFMTVKKNYSYLLSCKEGKILDPPKPSHTGIPVIKSDAAKLTQDMLGSMIVDVMLNSEIKRIDRSKAIVELVGKFKQKFDEDCDNYQFDYMGFPAKWSKKEIFIHAMKLYNFLMNDEIFNLGSSGKFIHCTLRNTSLLHPDFKAMKSPGIVVPYEYDLEQIKQLFERYQIMVNRKTHWEKLFNTSCQRVVDLAKSEAKSIL